MKRVQIVAAAAAMTLLLTAVAGCGLFSGKASSGSDSLSEQDSGSDSLSAVSSEQSSEESSVESSSEESSYEPQEQTRYYTDKELFTDSAFVGNSCVERLYLLGYAPLADFFSRTGLTVKTVFTDHSNRGTVPISEEFNCAKEYKRVFIMFGENELGWPNLDIFIDYYGQLIDRIRSYQPQVEVFIMGIPPVSADVSARSPYGVNNERIAEYNMRIARMCEQRGDATFLDIGEYMRDETGALPDDGSTDGIHLTNLYCGRWIQYIRDHVTYTVLE